jgi:hypothetical protein
MVAGSKVSVRGMEHAHLDRLMQWRLITHTRFQRPSQEVTSLWKHCRK